MIDVTGAGALARLVLRRDRVRFAIWIVAIAGLVYAQAVSIKGLYPDPAELAEAARLVEDNAAFIAMAGPPLALDTLGGRVTFEISAFAMVLAALMNLLLVTRNVRGDEEAGRTELLRSTVVARHAPVAAALTMAVAVDLALFVLTVLALLSAGLETAGSVALAGGMAGVGLCFGAVAGLTSQVTVSPRLASGLAGAALGASFVLRGIGDVGYGCSPGCRPWAGARRCAPSPASGGGRPGSSSSPPRCSPWAPSPSTVTGTSERASSSPPPDRPGPHSCCPGRSGSPPASIAAPSPAGPPACSSAAWPTGRWAATSRT